MNTIGIVFQLCFLLSSFLFSAPSGVSVSTYSNSMLFSLKQFATFLQNGQQSFPKTTTFVIFSNFKNIIFSDSFCPVKYYFLLIRILQNSLNRFEDMDPVNIDKKKIEEQVMEELNSNSEHPQDQNQKESKDLKEIPQSNDQSSNNIDPAFNKDNSKEIESLSKTLEQNKISEKQQSLTPQQLQLKAELESMQFESDLILEAIHHTSDLQKAVEFIISKLESLEQKQIGQASSNEIKLFFIVRMDLKMGVGKIAAQVGHAALRAFQNIRYSSSTNDKSANLLIEWMEKGQKNVILQAQTQYELQKYLNQASQKYINNCYIRDAGRTQIAAGSMTVAAIGPVRQNQVNFLKHLKQL